MSSAVTGWWGDVTDPTKPGPGAAPESQDVREAQKRAHDAWSSLPEQTQDAHARISWLAGYRAALAQSDAEPASSVTFWYRNYRGEISRRVVVILGLRWGSSEYHKEPQWLLLAFDFEKGAEREFAVKDMAPTREALYQSDARRKFTLNEVEAALDRALEKRGFRTVERLTIRKVRNEDGSVALDVFNPPRNERE